MTKPRENETTDKLNVNPPLIREEVNLIFRWLEVDRSLPSDEEAKVRGRETGTSGNQAIQDGGRDIVLVFHVSPSFFVMYGRPPRRGGPQFPNQFPPPPRNTRLVFPPPRFPVERQNVPYFPPRFHPPTGFAPGPGAANFRPAQHFQPQRRPEFRGAGYQGPRGSRPFGNWVCMNLNIFDHRESRTSPRTHSFLNAAPNKHTLVPEIFFRLEERR